jgi:phenylpropionate dioxygenase-like ring-hydroxylating dioxygenase large terminal subunit
MAITDDIKSKKNDARCEGWPSYQDVLDNDSKEAPFQLRAESAPFIGDDGIPVDHYISEDYFKKEAAKMWPKVWQMACREEEIPNVGDYIIYEVVGKSLIVTRTAPNKFKALHNVCLHRGRKLVTEDGSQTEFRCPYHGFTWKNNGAIKEIPCQWDFKHLQGKRITLPSAKVETWGGFIFINMDENAKPLKDTLGIMPEHFDERWRPQDRYISAHVGKIVPANWKAVAEAFMESYHVIDTHPQIMPYMGDANSQYDIFSDTITRQITASGIQSPHLGQGAMNEQMILDSMMATNGRFGDPTATLQVPEGQKARAYMADIARQANQHQDGHDYSDKSDAEMLDALLYNIFPNLSVWAGYGANIVYRWRPNGMDVNSGLMEVYQLKLVPKGQPRPAPAEYIFLEEDQGWDVALGNLGLVLEQDQSNLPHVQSGMIASETGVVELGNYQEMRLRQMHNMIDKYIDA